MLRRVCVQELREFSDNYIRMQLITKCEDWFEINKTVYLYKQREFRNDSQNFTRYGLVNTLT